MESKLQKPSGLKRPIPLLKSILPMDRIKSSVHTGFGGKTNTTGTSVATIPGIQPLTRDLVNLQEGIALGETALKRRVRAASPELTRPPLAQGNRAKLRRSRSACDVREMRPLKRPDNTLGPIPSKSARFMSGASGSTTALNSINTSNSNNSQVRPIRIGNATTTIKSATGVHRKQLGSTSTITAAAAATTSTTSTTRTKTGNYVSAVKSASTTKSNSVSTTGAGKTINKRIPPYDYKARFNDLLEKHKAIKEKLDEKSEQLCTYENLPEQLEESQSQLYSTQDQLKNTQTENECLLRQVKSQNMKIEAITNELVKNKEDLIQLKQAHEKMQSEHSALSVEVIELRTSNTELTTRNAFLTEELAACKEQLFFSNMERKELHNTVMDLRGNIRVFCRVRPPLDCEQEKLLCGWNYVDDATVEIQQIDALGNSKSNAHTFNFDYVFHPGSRQDDIFEMVSPLIQSALDGYNICIFAYGQTGSGKTYTMDGVVENPGVIPRTVDLLFDSITNYKRLGWEYEIKVTFLEIYNEVLYDLLSNEQKDMEIRMVKNNKNDVYVSNITRKTVDSAARLRQLMQVAKMNRATAATVGNERSSRSHAVTKIELIGSHEEKNEISLGSINLVDLAGSESPKTSTRMNETKNINRSLSELTNVILALLQKQDHVPYRNSKLTHLLMPSLGGNSKTLMFINVSPFVDCYGESVKSLRFAASVNSCKMSKAKRVRIYSMPCNNSSSNSSNSNVSSC